MLTAQQQRQLRLLGIRWMMLASKAHSQALRWHPFIVFTENFLGLERILTLVLIICQLIPPTVNFSFISKSCQNKSLNVVAAHGCLICSDIISAEPALTTLHLQSSNCYVRPEFQKRKALQVTAQLMTEQCSFHRICSPSILSSSLCCAGRSEYCFGNWTLGSFRQTSFLIWSKSANLCRQKTFRQPQTDR